MGWPGRAWPGCGPASRACCPGREPCQVSDSISRPFLLREPNIFPSTQARSSQATSLAARRTLEVRGQPVSPAHQAGQGGGSMQKGHSSNWSPTSQRATGQRGGNVANGVRSGREQLQAKWLEVRGGTLDQGIQRLGFRPLTHPVPWARPGPSSPPANEVGE